MLEVFWKKCSKTVLLQPNTKTKDLFITLIFVLRLFGKRGVYKGWFFLFAGTCSSNFNVFEFLGCLVQAPIKDRYAFCRNLIENATQSYLVTLNWDLLKGALWQSFDETFKTIQQGMLDQMGNFQYHGQLFATSTGSTCRNFFHNGQAVLYKNVKKLRLTLS